MAGKGRIYKIAFKLNAMLGSSFGKSFDKAEGIAERAERAFSKTGKMMTLGVTAPLLAVGAAALRVGEDFNQSLGTIQSRTGMAADEVNELGQSFRQMALSGNYGTFSARDTASAFANVALYGQDAAHATEKMRVSMLLATSTGNDLTGSAYVLGNALIKLQKDSEDAYGVANILATAYQRVGVSIDNTLKFMGRVAPIKSEVGMSTEGLAGLFSVLYQEQINAVNSSSGLTNVLQTLTAQSGRSAVKMEQLGISAFYADGTQRALMDVVDDLRLSMYHMTEQQRAYTLEQLGFSQYGLAVADIMLTQNDRIGELTSTMLDATSAAEGYSNMSRMAGIENSGLAASGAMLRNSLEEISIQISEQLMPHALRLVGGIGSLVQRFASLDESTQRNIFRLAALAAAIGPVLMVTSKLIKAYRTAKSIFIAVATATKVVTAAQNANKAATIANRLATTAASKAELARKKLGAKHATTIALLAKAENARTVATNLSTQAQAANAKVTKTATVVTKILALGTKALSVGFKVMSVAIMKIPVFGWILAAVAGVIAIVRALVGLLGRVGEEYKAIADDASYLRDRQEQLTTAAANSAAEFERNTRVMQVAGQAYTELADRVRHLTEMQNNNLTERARLAEEAIVLELELYDVTAMREELEAKINDGTRRNRRSRNALNDALNDLIAAEEAYLEALNANASQIEAVNSLYEDNARALEEIARAQEQAMIETYGFEMAMRRQAFTAEEWANAQEQALDRMNRSFENYKRMTTNAFDTVNERAALSVSELTTNLLQNAQMVEEWSKNMAILTERGLDEGMIEQLRQAGPEAAATVRELVDASDAELEALNYAFGESTRVAVESMQRELDPAGVTESAEELIDMVAITILENQAMENALITKVNAGFQSFNAEIISIGFDESGNEIMVSTARGINSGTGELVEAMREAARKAIQAMRDELEMNSPSKKAIEIGQTYGRSVAMGLYSSYDEIERASCYLSKGMGGNFGYDTTYSVETGINRLSNLFPSDDDEKGGYGGTPFEAMKRMETAKSNYNGGSVSLTYSPSYVINGGGSDVSGIKQMVEQASQDSYGDMEELVRNIMQDMKERELMLSNG